MLSPSSALNSNFKSLLGRLPASRLSMPLWQVELSNDDYALLAKEWGKTGNRPALPAPQPATGASVVLPFSKDLTAELIRLNQAKGKQPGPLTELFGRLIQQILRQCE